ncbi:amino acid ABC transporter permease [Pseudalkalibacillus caeni]
MGFSQIYDSIPYILYGIWVTLQFVSVSAVFGFIWGIILALFKISRVTFLTGFADAYTFIFRGVPLILQLAIIYFATPQVVGYDITAFQAGVLAFSLHSGAYISEIIRAGILAVDKGQTEAAQALGVSYRPMMKDIILPQAMKNILPALMNEFITLTKESAIVSTIGVLDIMRRAQIVAADKFLYFPPLITAAVIYLILVTILTLLGRAVERRMRRSD